MFDIFVFCDVANKRYCKIDKICKQYPNAKMILSNTGVFDQLLTAQRMSTTKMFWFFNVDYQNTHDLNWEPELQDFNLIHVWTNTDDEVIQQSLSLWPVDRIITEEEFNTNKFEQIKLIKDNYKVVYDFIVFINKFGPEVTLHYTKLLEIYPNVKLIPYYINLKDLIEQAQNISTTKMFWLMNIEYNLIDKSILNWVPKYCDQQYVHILDDNILHGLSLWPSDIEQNLKDEFLMQNVKILMYNTL
jgi:hypothetical protein